jgi:hypothetical protein
MAHTAHSFVHWLSQLWHGISFQEFLIIDANSTPANLRSSGLFSAIYSDYKLIDESYNPDEEGPFEVEFGKNFIDSRESKRFVAELIALKGEKAVFKEEEIADVFIQKKEFLEKYSRIYFLFWGRTNSSEVREIFVGRVLTNLRDKKKELAYWKAKDHTVLDGWVIY